MISDSTQNEIEQYLGQVPSWMTALAEPAADHSWGVVRDLEFGETDLTQREKELVGLGAATAINCPYCIHFHTEGAKMEDVSEDERAEATNVAANVQYFSTILHGAEIDYEEFVDETAEIVNHIETQQAAAGDD